MLQAEKDLRITNILQTLLKLKAAVTTLVGTRDDMIDEIQKIYFEQSTLSLDPEVQKKIQSQRTEF